MAFSFLTTYLYVHIFQHCFWSGQWSDALPDLHFWIYCWTWTLFVDCFSYITHNLCQPKRIFPLSLQQNIPVDNDILQLLQYPFPKNSPSVDNYFFMNWLCELSTTTCSSITEKKFKLSIEVFFLVVLIDIEIKDWFWCKWKNFLFINDTVVDNILFFLFICKQHTYILYIISKKNVEKRWFYGILENKVRTFTG